MAKCFTCDAPGRDRGKRYSLVTHHVDGHGGAFDPDTVLLCLQCQIEVHRSELFSRQQLLAFRNEIKTKGGEKTMLRQLVYNDLMGRQRTEAVAREWGAVAAEYEEICGYKEAYERADVVKFLAHLRKRQLALTTIKKDLKVVKLLAEVQGWKMPKISLPRVKEQDITRTIFSKEQVISLIQTGKQLLEPKQLAYLALATTYGLRRQEMCNPKPPEFEDSKVTIYTAHGASEKTTHLVPPEIAPYLDHFRPYGPDYMSHMFMDMLLRVGLKVGADYGWHSIRRSLATELILSEASALNVMRFMRWSEASMRGEFGMLAIYAKRDQARIDTDIFKIHPFLPYWGKME